MKPVRRTRRRFARRIRPRQIESLEPRLVLDSTVVFNELMYHPPGADDTQEWVELHNQMAVNMDLSGWSLEGGVSFRFPEGTTVPGGGYLLVAKDPEALAAESDGAAVFGPFAGKLDNGGEEVSLRNRNDRAMDSLEYQDHGDWPVGPDGSGASLAKRDPQSSSGSPSNWTSSVELGGTPGRANFPIVDLTPVVSTVVPLNVSWRYDASGADLPDSWRDPAMDDSAWSQGEATLFAGSFATLPPPDSGVIDSGSSVMLQNSSFETNTNGGVGYGSVTGWTAVGGTGVNPSSIGSAPFADNGRIPDSQQIAFIQGSGSLSQRISGLDTTKQYWLQLYYNARNCCGGTPALTVSFGNQVLVPSTPVTPVGGSNPYHFMSVPFTPRVSSGQLTIRNVGGAGDHSLLLDAVSIVQREAEQVIVQNPSFEATGGAPAAPGYMTARSLAGWTYESQGGSFGLNDAGGPFHDNSQIPDGQLVAFLQQSGSLTQTISGLEPGERYELQYHVNAQSAGGVASLSVELDDLLVHEEQISAAGDDAAYELRTHRFTAAGPSVDLAFQQQLSDPDAQSTLLLDNVSIRHLASPLVTELPLGPTTYYFRQSFDFAGDPAQTELQLRSFLDDGAVFYLNGVEVHRDNMPSGPVAAATLAAEAVGDPNWGQWQTLPADLLISGRNVLAVEVHQAVINDTDMAFALELTATETPLDPTLQRSTLAINELSGADDVQATIELYNYGSRSVSLAGHELWLDGDVPQHIILPDQVLPAGGYAQLTHPLIPPQLTPVERVFLVDPARNVLIDAGRVEQRVKGRIPDGQGPWYAVDTLTPAAANRVTLRDQIVINEIMYHPLPELEVPGTPATYERSTLVPMTWDQWRYNDTGASLPADWAQQVHSVDGQNWKLGQGLLGYESANLGVPINTQFTRPSLNDPRFLTYYFQTDLEIPADLHSQIDLVEISHLIDTGAVFYLNGEELFRFNLPDGPIDASTRAAPNVNNAERIGPISIPTELLQVGTNLLSAELHLRGETNSDVVFGAEVVVGSYVAPPTPGSPFQEREDLEWIELYNRGTETIDLSGWSLQDGIDFDFPASTYLGAGEYLVVASDRLLLADKYPDIATRVIGDYARDLGNAGDRLVLMDARQNPVDVVHYSDGRGWPAAADGGGASLELRDPEADNSRPETWAASRPSDDIRWQTYSYRAFAAEPDGLSVPSYFDEFILGLLDEGEVLLDDLRVIEDPAGAAIDRLQNGSFEGDSLGATPDAWRIIGNHNQSAVMVDPDDPGNHLLRLVATGPTEHMHNHAETTLANGAQITDGKEYEISFRAKWLSGSPQLNTRLYFSRNAQTTVLQTSDRGGTPGAANSVAEANLGPTFHGLRHAPLAPDPDQPVTVSVVAEDPDGVQSLTLYYSVNGQTFLALPMLRQPEGQYLAMIPPQVARATVQFYVEGVDSRGARSHYPAAGADSRALYRVPADSLDAAGVHTLRLIMTATDVQWLHASENVMSNGRLGATVIYNDRDVFYDVGVRLRASGYGRQGGLAGFNIEFPADQLFRGVHSGIALDRGVVLSSGTGSGGVSGRPGASPHELLIYQAAHHAGGIAGMYDDVVYVDAPRSGNTGLAQLKMARYSDVFLDSQFEDGGDGSLFKYELIYHSTTTVDGNPQSLKRAPNAVLATDISDLGDDEEAYRHNFILKSNRARDDFQRIIELGKAFSLTGSALDTATQQVMDVDQWMRLFALQSLIGVADVYNMGLPHNLDLYVRPSDQKVLALPWDVDHGFYYSPRAALLGVGSNNLRKVIALPHNRRLFYKHLLDIVQTTYNVDYLGPWADHYSQITEQDLATFFQEYVGARSQYVLDELARVAPQIPFQVTTNGGNALTVDDDSIVLQGQGWIDVHQLKLAGGEQPLNVTWTDQDSWQVELPLQPGLNELILQADDYQGRLVGTDAIPVTSTVSQRPLQDFLRAAELMYNPPEPTSAELLVNGDWEKDDFEFIELWNSSPSLTLDLSGVRISDGPSEVFEFNTASIRSLSPGQRLMVVSDREAFQARYGSDATVAGTYSGNLRNSGERIRIEDSLGAPIADFQYGDSDPWPKRADGNGSSLELIDPSGTSLEQMGKPSRWRGSTQFGGSPGDESVSSSAVVINEVLSGPTGQQSDAIELWNPTAAAVDIGGWYLTDSMDQLKFHIPLHTVLPAGDYIVFDERDFNPTPNNPAPHHFGLSGTRGDDVWLVVADAAGTPMRFVDDVHFGPARTGESFSRVPDGTGRLAPTRSTTLGAPNAAPRVGPVRISEVHYHPAAASPEAVAIQPGVSPEHLEFVVVQNPLNRAVDLTGWQLDGDAAFNFPSGVQLDAGDRAVLVSFDPDDPAIASLEAAFRANYPSLPSDQVLLGPYDGGLSDDQGLLQLLRSESLTAGDPTTTTEVLEDEVFYDDSPPWPQSADGLGWSLQRKLPTAYGNLAGSWEAADPLSRVPRPAGDLNADGQINAGDIDELCAGLHRGDPQFDLNGDGMLDDGDLTYLVETLLQTVVGDANVDGRFNSSDLVQVFQVGEYEDSIEDNSSWAEGDWNCDGDFTSSDLVAAFQAGGYVAQSSPAASRAAERADLLRLLAGCFATEDDRTGGKRR